MDRIIRSSSDSKTFHKQSTKGSTFLNFRFKTEILWNYVLMVTAYHLIFAFSVYRILTGQVALITLVFASISVCAALFGNLGGAHRLWSHNSYKATWQLRSLLMLLQTMSVQNTIHKWVREHRAHHKYADTDADPHSAGRGFFFAHMGWTMLRKHPDAVEKGKLIDMRDIEADEIVMFQKRNYFWLMPVFAFILPTAFYHYVLRETITNAFLVGCVMRIIASSHLVSLINSFSHFFGSKPYDKNIMATNNSLVAIFSAGEGWHNYHHAFPWDYKNAELGDYRMNITCALIDFFSNIGWAYDLKTASDEVIIRRAIRTGDGLPYQYTNLLKEGNPLYEKLTEMSFSRKYSKEDTIWGWDDQEMDDEEREVATVINPKKAAN